MYAPTLCFNRLYHVNDDDLLNNEEISLELLSSIKSVFSKITDRISQAFSTVWFNIRSLDKDYTHSDLTEFLKDHREAVSAYLKIPFSEKEIYAVPDGLKESYNSFSHQLLEVLKESHFKETIKQISLKLSILQKDLPRLSQESESIALFKLKEFTTLHKKEIDELTEKTITLLKENIDKSHSRPKKAVDLFKDKTELKEVIDTVASFDIYQRDLVDVQYLLKQVMEKIRITGSVVQSLSFPKAFKKSLAQYLIALGKYVESYGILIHETIRLGYNLVLSLRKHCVKSQS